MREGIYDTVIVGAGPAGISASIYAVRKRMNFLLVSESVGGQVLTSGDIENFLGYAEIDGVQLVDRMIAQMNHLGIEPFLDRVVSAERAEDLFLLKTLGGQELLTKTLLLCTGSEHRKLNVPGEKEYTGRGVSYCYTCDAPFFRDRKVAVVGGGNAGLEAVEQLINYAEKIYLIEVGDSIRADEILRERVLGNPKLELLLRTRVREIRGDRSRVTSVLLEDLEAKRLRELEVEGVFVEIGLVPKTELADQLGVIKNERGEVVIDCNNRTSEEGVYAAGDCTNIFAKQIITAAGEGAKALLSLYHELIYSPR